MRQYKLCIQIIIIIIKKKEDKSQKGDGRIEKGVNGERERRRFLFLFFLLFPSLLDLRKSDRRFLLEQKAKLVYVTRATREHRKLSVLSNSKR